MSKKWKKISSQEIYDNPWITVHHDQVITPNDTNAVYGKVSFKNLAIAIIPLDDDMNTWIVGQHRYTIDTYSWEIPMGGGPLDIDPLISAQRELREETGIRAADWQHLMTIHTSNCVTDEVGHVYIARQLRFGETEFDDTEDLKIKKLPFKQVVQMVMDGDISDSISMTAILKLDKLLRVDH